MAYNYYPNTYQVPAYYPQQNNSFPLQNQTQQQSGIIWVQGESGAKSYLVAPNTSVVLFDSEAQTIYIKSADASGLPNIKVLDYTMRDSAPSVAKFSPVGDYVTKDDISVIKSDIESLKAKFEEMEGKKK